VRKCRQQIDAIEQVVTESGRRRVGGKDVIEDGL